jgi:CelD/BcsL family acetyltransferase involved in cellulose biosynthesis
MAQSLLSFLVETTPPFAQRPTTMIHVREINDIDHLDAYRADWDSLLRQTPRATFFRSFDWLEAYWRHYGDPAGPNQRLRVLIIAADDRVIGILPLVVRVEDTRVGNVRTLTYPLQNWGSYYGPIGPNPAATLDAAMNHLRQTPRDWDLLDLRWVDATEGEEELTESAMAAAGFSPKRQAWDQTAVLEIDGDWDAYWRSRPQKWRENLRRDQRYLSQLGKVTYVRYRPKGSDHGDDDPRWDLYQACIDVARRSWQGSSATGNTLCHGSVADFLRDVHEAAARTGSLDLNLLFVDDRPVAFIYNYVRDGRVYGLRMGFDPELAAAGPGRVLQWRMLEDSFRRGDSHFDLGVGSLECKRYWWTKLVTSYRYTYFPLAAPRAQALRLKRWYVRCRHGESYLAGCKSRPQGA